MSENESMWAQMTAFLAIMLIIALGFLSVVKSQRNELKEEAVKRDYAEWLVIGENDTEFKWKEKQ